MKISLCEIAQFDGSNLDISRQNLLDSAVEMKRLFLITFRVDDGALIHNVRIAIDGSNIADDDLVKTARLKVIEIAKAF